MSDEKIKRIKCLDCDNMLDYPSKDGRHHIYCPDCLPKDSSIKRITRIKMEEEKFEDI
jgi:Zn finger protein HypA/HybF involved in hydrogenase expression